VAFGLRRAGSFFSKPDVAGAVLELLQDRGKVGAGLDTELSHAGWTADASENAAAVGVKMRVARGLALQRLPSLMAEGRRPSSCRRS